MRLENTDQGNREVQHGKDAGDRGVGGGAVRMT